MLFEGEIYSLLVLIIVLLYDSSAGWRSASRRSSEKALKGLHSISQGLRRLRKLGRNVVRLRDSEGG